MRKAKDVTLNIKWKGIVYPIKVCYTKQQVDEIKSRWAKEQNIPETNMGELLSIIENSPSSVKDLVWLTNEILSKTDVNNLLNSKDKTLTKNKIKEHLRLLLSV